MPTEPQAVSPECFQPKSLSCCDCGESYIWTVGEQEFFRDKQFPPPKRCPACRKHRSIQIAKTQYRLLHESKPEYRTGRQ